MAGLRLPRLLHGSACLGLSAVWIIAALPKIHDPVRFHVAIGTFEVLPASAALVVAYVLPMAEVVLALALLLPRWQRAAALSSLLLLAGFCLLIAQALLRGLDGDCGCFGAGRALSIHTLLLDLLLLLLAASVWWFSAAPTHSAGPRSAPRH